MSCRMYGEFTLALGSCGPLCSIEREAELGATGSSSTAVWVSPPEATWTTMSKRPASVGVPLSSPRESSEMPLGGAPARSDQVLWPPAPCSVNAQWYVAPTMATSSLEGLVICSGLLVRLRATEVS